MIDREYLQYMVGEHVYFKGMQIYNGGKILDVSVDEAVEEDYVEAFVKGSGTNIYQVTLRYDLENDDVDYVECDCPAYYNYDGVCKHCVAVILAYIDYKNETDGIFDADEFEIGSTKSPSMLNTRATTPEMKILLSNMVKKKLLPMKQDEFFGRVKIQPYLECDQYEINLKFKLGISCMYVLKDIFSFTDAMENKKDVSYGKKLKFLHMPEAFESESRVLAEFICQWAQKNAGMMRQPSYYGYYGRQSLKMITLDTSELEEFLNLVGKRILMANVNMEGEKQWRITNQELQRNLTIKGNQQGIEVKVEPVFGYSGNHDYIYFQDQKIYKIPKEQMEPISEFVKLIAKMPNYKVFIQKEDVPVFCREMLPVLEQFYQCKKIDFKKEDYGFTPVSFEVYLDAPQKDLITCELIAVYGDRKYNVYGNQEEKGIRDVIRETEIGECIAPYFNAYDEQGKKMVIAHDDELLYELLVTGIANMQAIGEVFISDALKRIKITPAPKVSAGVSLSGDLLELSITTGEMPRKQLMEILSKYDRNKKFYRLKDGTFMNVEDENFVELQNLKRGLFLTDRQMKEEKIAIPKYRALYIDSELKGKSTLLLNRNKEFCNLIHNMKTVEEHDFNVPKSLESILREYQKKGFLWMKTLKNNGFGGILADDMGLGKTLQVIALLLSEYEESTQKAPTLIVTPASLVFNWKSEIQTFAPVLPVKMVTGTMSERKDIIDAIEPGDIVITSYDLLKRDIEQYEMMTFECQVIDEAQYIKNHNTQAAKAVKQISAGFKLALTGTPVENRLSELWSIFDYLMNGFLYSYQKFRREIEQPIIQNKDERAMGRLQKMIRPFVLRRLKKDVLKDLPDKLEKVVYVKLEGEQQKLYDAHVQRMQMMLEKQTAEEFRTSKIQVLAELTKLRQICCNPELLFDKYQENSGKTEACLDLLENAVNGGHKVLLFSQFVSIFEGLCSKMDKRGLRYMTLTGKDSKEKRREMVEKFQTGDIPVFCISLKAGGTGLNLTAADIVIHYDPWWNLAVQNQATDRVHRIGQTNKVVEYKLIMKDTIEEKIIQLQEKKKELAEQVLEGRGIDSGSFNREEILELLGDTLS